MAYYTGGKLTTQETNGSLTHAFRFNADQVLGLSAGTGAGLVTLAAVNAGDIVELAYASSDTTRETFGWGPADLTITIGTTADADGFVLSMDVDGTNTAFNNGALFPSTGNGIDRYEVPSATNITATFGGAVADISTGREGAAGSVVVGLRVVQPSQFV